MEVPELTRKLTVAEFYSGIGGMHFALDMIASQMNIHAEVKVAFDVNTVANSVYSYNFKSTPSTKTIETLRKQDLDSIKADVFLMSPPCQPYTRGGNQKGGTDSRSQSFHHLLQLIPQLAHPPTFILIENVKGFDTSDSHTLLIQTLKAMDYHIQEFMLSPHQFGTPNQRIRYFCLARMEPFLYPEYDGQLLEYIPDCFYFESQSKCKQISEYLEDSVDWNEFKPSESYLHVQSGYIHDICTPQSTLSSCFTKNYTSNYKGSGSLLSKTTEQTNSVDELRFFTPREIANLHDFPPEFQFPDEVNTKQRYRLLGNSLNVLVVAELLKYLLHSSEK